MKLKKRFLRVATVLGAMGLFLAMGVSDSHATLGLQIDIGNNGSFEFVAQDNISNDRSPADTVIGWLDTGYAGGTIITTNTGYSKPVIGSVTDPALDLSSSLQSSAGTTVKIQLSDTGFDNTSIAWGLLVSIGGTVTSGDGSYVITNIYRDLSNAQFGTNGLICSTGPLYPDGNNFDAFAGGCGNFLNADNEYSVTIETIIYLASGGDLSYDARFRLGSEGEIDVPEPTSMMLLGFGVLGLGAWRRRQAGKISI